MSRKKKQCIVHYDHFSLDDLSLTELRRESYDRLIQSKDARLQQISSVPNGFAEGELHAHRQCYQIFTKAMSVAAIRAKSSNVSLLKRRKRSTDNLGACFPNKCMKCDSNRPVKVKGQKQDVKVLQTFSACQTLQDAAKLQKDETMLLAISGQDLIAKEFKMHPKCYREYTRVCTKKQPSNEALAELPMEDRKQIANSSTNFEAVCEIIQNHVISGSQFVSHKILTEMYGFDSDDSRLRSKVKKRLEKQFGDSIIFVRVSCHETEIIVSQSALSTTTISSFMKGNKEFILKEAASAFRSDIKSMIENAPELPWPPTANSLGLDDRQPPKSVHEFILNIIHSTNHSPGDEVRYVESFSQDLVHAVSKGNFLMKKHVLLGTGLHSLTGQKIPINLLGRFGHCCNYDKVRLIETAQAEVVQKLRSLDFPLPLLPSNAADKVLTFFWRDNFNVQKENHLGSLHTTHVIAYQVKSQECIETQTHIEVQKSKRKTITCTPLDLPRHKIVPHKEPPKFEEQQSMEFDGQYADKIVFL